MNDRHIAYAVALGLAYICAHAAIAGMLVPTVAFAGLAVCAFKLGGRGSKSGGLGA